MRMWLVDPKIMCRQHLLGEHLEMHMFTGTIRKKIGISGYIRNNLLEPKLIKERHEELVEEMLRRGYNHDSPLDQPDISHLSQTHREWKMSRTLAKDVLLKRCYECRTRVGIS